MLCYVMLCHVMLFSLTRPFSQHDSIFVGSGGLMEGHRLKSPTSKIYVGGGESEGNCLPHLFSTSEGP